SKLNEQDSQLLLSLVRTAKEKMTTQNEAVIETTHSDGHKVKKVIPRQEFHNLTQNLVQKTIEPVIQALKDAGVTKADVKGVIMVGGSTRMLHVQQA
ncbi:Hsp70 family protein, partial [Neisseria sp. P0015.S010]